MVGDVKCACCSRLTEEHKMIACSICKKGFFHQCVELTTSELRTIKQKKNLSWSCTECASTSSNGVDELKLLIMSLQSYTEYDVIALVETWLSSDVLSSEAFPEDYIVFRTDRDLVATQAVRGGGVLLACRSYISCMSLDVGYLNNLVAFIDIVACKYQFYHSCMYIYVVYVPPQVTASQLESFLDLFEQTLSNQENVVILGDFNIASFVDTSSMESKNVCFKSFLDFIGFSQYNHILNSSQRLLDLIVSDKVIHVRRDDLPLVAEDTYHPALEIGVCANQPKRRDCISPNTKDNTSYNFRKADFVPLYQALLACDWSFLDGKLGSNALLEAFYNKLYSIFDLFVPRFKHNNRKYPCWFTAEIIYLIGLKDRYRKLYKRGKQESSYRDFSRIRKEIKTKMITAYENYTKSVEENICQDPRSFWAFIQRNKRGSRIPNNMQLGDKRIDGVRK
nr:unnamed protein product [Callosobruchus analis]